MEPVMAVPRVLKPLLHRRYDELTFPMAHDCHCVGDPKEWTFREKTRGPAEQIKDGIRAFRINTCYWKGSVRLNHGPPIAQYVFPVQTVFGSLEEFLQTLRDWLSEEKNKRKVVTIFDEIIPIYEKVFGDVTRWLLERIDGTPFPPFHEMVSGGPRIVVWMRQVERERAARPQETKKREEKDVRFRCFHSLWGDNVWQNPWCVYDEKHSEYAIWPDDITANKERGAGNRNSPLYLYNHLFYTEGINELPMHLRFIINKASGHFETSDYCKSHLAVGPLLNHDVIKAWKTTRRRPNFVNVDFYQGVKGARSNLFGLVSSLNHTDLIAPLNAPYPATAIASLRVPGVGIAIVLTAGGGLFLTTPNSGKEAMRLTLPEAPRFVSKATMLFDGKQLRVIAVNTEGHLCAGRVSFESSLPLAPVAPVMDGRAMREIHVCADVAPAAVIYSGRVFVAARRQPERERAKLLVFDERPNGTWHKHSFGFSSLASPHSNGATLVVANNVLWVFAVTEEGMVVTWRGTSTDSLVIDWEQKSLSEAIYDTHGSLSAFVVSDRHILCVAFTPSRAIVLHRYSTKRCGWSKEPKILQLGIPPTGLKGHLVSDLHDQTLLVAAAAECSHMVDEKLGLKGVALYSAVISHKSGVGEWRLSSPALTHAIGSADAVTGAVFYTMQEAAFASIPFEEDV